MIVCAIIIMSLWLPPSAGRPAPHVQGPSDSDALAKLEQALFAKPDDLRAGNDYRMALIKAGQYDRGLDFFEKLVAAHPSAPNAHLNYGFQYVDKIPVAGSITQVILANYALTEFSKSLEIKPSWIGYYTRGNSYLFWPRIFGRTKLGIADLEEALKIQKAEPKRNHHVRVYVALGDGHFKMDDLKKATAVWKEGLAEFPDSAALKQRLGSTPDAIRGLLDGVYDPNKRVDTNLQDLWSDK
jgi:tetratricopeptide (TPR) repeat protein